MVLAEYLAASAPFGRCSQLGHRMQHSFRVVRGLLITAPTGPRVRLAPVRRQFRGRQRVRP